MTTDIESLLRIHGLVDCQDRRITVAPTPSHDFSLHCNGDFIGGIYDDVLCVVATPAASALLDDPAPVLRGSSPTARHRMLEVPPEQAAAVIDAAWNDRYAGTTVLWDIEGAFEAESMNRDVVVRLYDQCREFLTLCFDHGLLRRSPTDSEGRLIRLRVRRADLTPRGAAVFDDLLDRFLAFLDRGGKSALPPMVGKWVRQLAPFDS